MMKRIKRMSLGLHFHDKPLKKIFKSQMSNRNSDIYFVSNFVLFSFAHYLYYTIAKCRCILEEQKCKLVQEVLFFPREDELMGCKVARNTNWTDTGLNVIKHDRL